VFASDQGEALFELKSRGFPLGAAEFNPHDPGCLTVETTGAIVLWDGSGHLARMLNRSGVEVNEAHFSSGGDKIVAACADQQARVWQRCFEPHLRPLDAVGEANRDDPSLFQTPYHFETTWSRTDQINELGRRTFRANSGRWIRAE